MTLYTINQYQVFTFNYADPTVGLYMSPINDYVGFNWNGTDYSFNVDAITTAGVFTFDIYDNTNTLYDTIQLTVTSVSPALQLTGCLSDNIGFTTFPLIAPSGDWVLTGNYQPDWLLYNPSFGFTVPIIPKVGTFYLLFEDSLNPLTNVMLIEFTFNSCLTEYDFCSKWKANLVWLNPAGGWSSYCFKGKKTYSVNIGERKSFKTSANIKKYYKIEDAYDTIEVLSGEIPISHLSFVKSLKYAIQVYLLRENGFIPVLVTDNEFDVYTDGDGLGFYNINIQYAEPINIQTQ